MKVEKVLNNNMVMSRNAQGREVILQGNAIGFGRKKGDVVCSSQVERMFVPNDKNEMNRYHEFFSNFPQAYWEVTEQIMKYAVSDCGLNVNDKVMLPLCDHIRGAVERYKDGIILNNPMKWEIRKLYPGEYQIGLYALKLIQRRFQVSMEEDEAAFLAFHFVYVQVGQNDDNIRLMTELIKDIMEIVEQCYQTDLDETSWDYQRFVTHLKYFAQRLFQGCPFSDSDEVWYEILRKQYPGAYNCVVKVADYIHDHYAYELSREEMFYLMIHIEKVTRNLQKN